MADSPSVGASSVTLDELEQTPPESPKLDDVKLDGDNVPEEFRGKSVADMLKAVKGLGDSLKLSEEARQRAETLAKLASERPAAAPIPAQPPVEEPKELSDEELNELYANEPLKAIRAMQDSMIRRVERNLNARIGSLTTGSASAVEQAARQKYPDEFKIFEQDIKDMVAVLPDKSVLANPQAWDDLVSFIRGKPGNWERFMAAKAAPSKAEAAANARQDQADTVGFSGTEARMRSIPGSVDQLDAIQKEIAANLDMTEAEYIKWSKVTA